MPACNPLQTANSASPERALFCWSHKEHEHGNHVGGRTHQDPGLPSVEKATEPRGTPEEYWEQARAEIEDEDAQADASGVPTEPPGTL